jgi:hypothetical protein
VSALYILIQYSLTIHVILAAYQHLLLRSSLSFHNPFSLTFLHTHYTYIGLMLHLISSNDIQTLRRTPLEEGSARRKRPLPVQHNIRSRKTSMPQLGFEPAIAAGERRQTHALDPAYTAIGPLNSFRIKSCMHFAQFPRTLRVPSISSPFIGMWAITQIMKIIRRGFSTSSYLFPLLRSYNSPKQPLLHPLKYMFFRMRRTTFYTGIKLYRIKKKYSGDLVSIHL